MRVCVCVSVCLSVLSVTGISALRVKFKCYMCLYVYNVSEPGPGLGNGTGQHDVAGDAYMPGIC